MRLWLNIATYHRFALKFTPGCAYAHAHARARRCWRASTAADRLARHFCGVRDAAGAGVSSTFTTTYPHTHHRAGSSDARKGLARQPSPGATPYTPLRHYHPTLYHFTVGFWTPALHVAEWDSIAWRMICWAWFPPHSAAAHHYPLRPIQHRQSHGGVGAFPTSAWQHFRGTGQ